MDKFDAYHDNFRSDPNQVDTFLSRYFCHIPYLVFLYNYLTYKTDIGQADLRYRKSAQTYNNEI